MLAGQKRPMLHNAASKGEIDIVKKELEQNGVDINLTFNGETALHAVAKSKRCKDEVEMTEFLLERRINIHAVDAHGASALHYAAAKGSFKMVELLVDQKVDVNVVTEPPSQPINVLPDIVHANSSKSRWSALHFAVANGSIDAVQLLANAGANVDAATVSRKTPIQMALERGHIEIAKFLLQKNCDIFGNITPDADSMNDHSNSILSLCFDGYEDMLHFAREIQIEVWKRISEDIEEMKKLDITSICGWLDRSDHAKKLRNWNEMVCNIPFRKLMKIRNFKNQFRKIILLLIFSEKYLYGEQKN